MPDIRSDFTVAAVITPDQLDWVASPGGEVERAMLDRVGDEVAVATSLVRYPPGSRFPPHEHGRGEEYLVLDGEFGDEHGRYPVGTYVRNPPGSRHAPLSETGCVIWVKLRQFHPDDSTQLRVALNHPIPPAGSARQVLHRFQDEVVTAIFARAGASIRAPATSHVQEVLVIDGSVTWEGRRLDPWAWLRQPAGEALELAASSDCRLLHKVRPWFALPEPPPNAGR